MKKTKPMLAKMTRDPEKFINDDGYGSQVKYNGKAVFAKKDRIWIARGDVNTDLTADYPEVVEDLAKLECHSCILHGELVHLDNNGREVQITAVKLTEETRRGLRAVLVVHDVLEFNGQDTGALHYLARFGIYRNLVRYHAHLMYAPLFTTTEAKDVNHRRIIKLGLEGEIYKRLGAPYAPGKTDACLKWKPMYDSEGHDTADCVVIGATKGKGKYAGKIGALLLGQYREGKLCYVGKCSGMTDSVRDDLLAKLSQIHIVGAATFDMFYSKEQLRGANRRQVLFWCVPAMVVEIHYLVKTAKGHYLSPQFERERDDKLSSECVDANE